MKTNLRSNMVKGQGHWERKRKNRFFRVYLRHAQVDRFTSNQD